MRTGPSLRIMREEGHTNDKCPEAAFMYHAMLIFIFSTVLVLWVQHLCKTATKFYRRSQVNLELEQIFSWFWDGTPEDELYAWYKVRTVIKQREGKADHEKLAQVDKKIFKLDKKMMHSDLFVNPAGRLESDSIDLINSR